MKRGFNRASKSARTPTTPVPDAALSMKTRAISDSDRSWAAAAVAQNLGTPEVISREVRHDTSDLPGMVPDCASDGTPIDDELEYERRLDAAGPGTAPDAGSGDAPPGV